MLKLFFLLLFLPGPNCRDAYLNEVLSSQAYDRYFIIVKANVNGKIGEISIANYHLFEVLQKHDSRLIDLEHYKQFMTGKINKQETVNLTGKDLKQADAGFIVRDREVERAAAKGVSEVFKKYFRVSSTGKFAQIRPNVSLETAGAIEKVLFENNYLMSVDEGKFSIDDMTFCQDHSK